MNALSTFTITNRNGEQYQTKVHKEAGPILITASLNTGSRFKYVVTHRTTTEAIQHFRALVNQAPR